MSLWDWLKGTAEADKQAGSAPLTGTGIGLSQDQKNWYDINYDK
jgi:hypothetical protein